MRLTLAAAVLFAAAVGLTAAPVPKDKDKAAKDEDAIQGSWKIESFEAGGPQGAPPKEALDAMRFVFKKDGKMSLTGGPGGQSRDGEYKMDAKASPKTLDMTLDGKPALAIYELDGDTFKMCMSEGKDPRPTEFKPGGPRMAVVTFKRVKDEEKKEEKKDK